MRPPLQSTETERSRPHRRIEKILDNMGLSYMSEQPFPPYTVDIYFTEWHLAIEVDGPYHSKTKDQIRDKWLKARYGLEVLHLDVKKNWLKRVKAETRILEFITLHADSTAKRKAIGN